MKVELRISQSLWARVQGDLDRPHPFAGERVGFLMTRLRPHAGNSAISLEAAEWRAIEDADYLRNDRVGASIGPVAFRKILQYVYQKPFGILHVHRHEHRGRPAFSRIDAISMRSFIPSFFNAQPDSPHGALVLSIDSAHGVVRLATQSRDLAFSQITVQ